MTPMESVADTRAGPAAEAAAKAAAAAPHHGGCQCGQVRYVVRGPLRPVKICHCRMCRRLSTLAGAYSACAPGHLEIPTKKGLRWFRSSPFAQRGFCRNCGAQLFWAPGHGRHVSIAAGSLDEPVALAFEEEMFPDHRPAWWPPLG